MTTADHPVSKGQLLREVNEGIRAHVVSLSDRPPHEIWEFNCECEEPACREHARLTLARYVGLRDAGEAILAPGHTISGAAQGRRQADALIESARALVEQARHQARRSSAALSRARGLSQR